MQIECTLDNDARLIAGVGTLIERAARYAGVAQKDREGMATAAIETCREAFTQACGGSGSPGKQRGAAIRIRISHGHDRMEVAVEYEGQPMSEARQKALRESAGDEAREGAAAGQLRFETSKGRCWVKLSKCCGAVKVKAGCPSDSSS